MNRPSHWILGFLAVLGGVLWWSGALQTYLSARPAETPAAGSSAQKPVVVRRDTPPPRPINSEVSGRVVDRLGFPVVGAKVRVAEAGGPLAQGAGREAAGRETAGRETAGRETAGRETAGADAAGDDTVSTDARGRFRLTVSGAVHKRLSIEAPGRHAPVEVQGSLDELDVVLQDAVPWLLPAGNAEVATAAARPSKTGLLVGEGWVRDAEGRRAPGVRVTVRETGATACSDDDGRFVVPLDQGNCTLVAWDGRGGVAVSETGAPLRPQGKVPLPDLQLAEGPTLRGRLVNGDGDPLVDAAVVVETGGVRRATRTGQGGLFSVEGLVAGACELTVLPHRGHLGKRMPALMVDRDVNLEDVVVRRPRQEPLRLRVVDPSGSPQAFVHVVAEQFGGLCRAYAQADAHGDVALRGLGDDAIAFTVRDRQLEPLRVARFDDQSRTLVVE